MQTVRQATHCIALLCRFSCGNARWSFVRVRFSGDYRYVRC